MRAGRVNWQPNSSLLSLLPGCHGLRTLPRDNLCLGVGWLWFAAMSQKAPHPSFIPRSPLTVWCCEAMKALDGLELWSFSSVSQSPRITLSCFIFPHLMSKNKFVQLCSFVGHFFVSFSQSLYMRNFQFLFCMFHFFLKFERRFPAPWDLWQRCWLIHPGRWLIPTPNPADVHLAWVLLLISFPI